MGGVGLRAVGTENRARKGRDVKSRKATLSHKLAKGKKHQEKRDQNKWVKRTQRKGAGPKIDDWVGIMCGNGGIIKIKLGGRSSKLERSRGPSLSRSMRVVEKTHCKSRSGEV